MTEAIPTWWLILSGLFFFLNAALFAVLAYAVYKLIPAVKAMTDKIGELSTRVEHVATKVEDMSKQVSGILGSIEVVTHSAARQVEKFSPVLVAIMTGIRVVKAVTDYRSSHSNSKAPAKLEPKKSKLLGLF
jgi:uncharacterized protein YoxC